MDHHSHTHEEISQRAQQIWARRGQPEGCDTDIWLEAERELSAREASENRGVESTGRDHAPHQPDAPAADHPTDLIPGGVAAKVAQQKKAARAPKVPAKTIAKSVPAETGKPLWNKPHSA